MNQTAVQWVLSGRWMLERTAFERILMTAHPADPNSDDSGDTDEPDANDPSGVVVMPIRGVMMPRPENYSTGWDAETYTEAWGRAFDEMVRSRDVSAIVIDVDSPGGLVVGTPELAERIYNARGTKPIVAVANGRAASAAYYVASAADTLYVSPSGEVGSIGVVATHVDMSDWLESAGFRVEFVHAGRFKVEGHPFAPLGDDARAEWQREVDRAYEAFVEDVAKHRGVSADTVRADFGEGRMFDARRAVDAGLVDAVATLDVVVAELEARTEHSVQHRTLSNAETRNVTEGATASDETISGVAVRYDSLSQDLGGFVEEFAPGALDDSVASDDLRVIWQHDSSKVLGRTSAGTATFGVDNNEVRYEANPPDAQWARDALESVRRGDVSGSSFAFRVLDGGDRFERRDGQVVRVVTRARLLEAGPQTFPAYEDTSVAVRGLNAFLDAEKRELAIATERHRHLARMDALSA